MKASVFIGWDPREAAAFAVARETVRRNVPSDWVVKGLVLADLQASGLYTRPLKWALGPSGKEIMWDVISAAAMSTEHACARFLVPTLSETPWAIFMDGDMLVRTDLEPLVTRLDPKFAVHCVKHQYAPPPGIKMDGQEQTRYARKNWSSFMVFRCDHPANAGLTPEIINSLPGRDLHRFCWLADEEIGELSPSWNFLVGHTNPVIRPDVVHFTEGVPDMAGYEAVPYAEEWRGELTAWARGGA